MLFHERSTSFRGKTSTGIRIFRMPPLARHSSNIARTSFSSVRYTYWACSPIMAYPIGLASTLRKADPSLALSGDAQNRANSLGALPGRPGKNDVRASAYDAECWHDRSTPPPLLQFYRSRGRKDWRSKAESFR